MTPLNSVFGHPGRLRSTNIPRLVGILVAGINFINSNNGLKDQGTKPFSGIGYISDLYLALNGEL